MDFTQGVHELLVVDFSLWLLQGHQNLVGTTESLHILDEGLHVLMLQRNHFGESGLNRQVGRHIAEHHSNQSKQYQQLLAITEYRVAQRAYPVVIEIIALKTCQIGIVGGYIRFISHCLLLPDLIGIIVLITCARSPFPPRQHLLRRRKLTRLCL